MGQTGDCFFRDKVLQPGEGHGWLAHDHAVLTLVVRGRLDECFDSGVQRCGAFELHYKPRGLPHATSTGPDGVRMLLVGLRDAPQVSLEGFAPDRPCILSGNRRAARALNELVAIAASGPAGNEPPHHAVRRLWKCLESEGRREAPAGPSWLAEVRERIRREGATRYGLQRLARGVGVHPVYLARVFRRHYGVTTGVFRRRQRVERGLARLRTEDTPLAEIALDLGYADQSHFCRELKRETGWTPGRYRQVSSELATAPQPP